MLEGLADITPGIALLDDQNVVVRADLPGPAQRQVAVISGGGAGHESAHAGYLGSGMLHATVSGDVFTLLPGDAVMAAIQAVAGPAGVVLVVKNYTGDRLNFALAAEIVRAAGIPSEIVVVADDVALRETVEPSRHRGIAGTVLIHKIAGAAAEAGAPVHEVAEAAQRHARCDHRRPKDRPWQPRGSVGERPRRQPPTELAIVARAAMSNLKAQGLVVERAWSGTLLSALEMPGVSLSVLVVDDARLAQPDVSTAASA